jgi:CRP-like cAMP-binding protein
MTSEINTQGLLSKEFSGNSVICANLTKRVLPLNETIKTGFFTAQEINVDNRILNSLPQFDLVRLTPHLEYLYLTAGKTLYQPSKSIDYIYFPETAVISNISDLEDGNTIETAMVGNEGMTGVSSLLGAETPVQRSQVIIKGAAWRIKTDILKEGLSKPGTLQTLIFDYLNNHMNQISQRLICKSFHMIEQRLCSWLLMLQDRSTAKELLVTHESTALLLGSQRPSISLAAQLLRKKGLIDYSRGGVIIRNREKMEHLACECYTVYQNKSMTA